MRYADMLVKECADPALRAAFRAYFDELGVQIRDWDGLFAEVSAGNDAFLVRRDERGRVIGFLLFAITEATAWRGFFTMKLGCVEEFWVDPAHRGQGHGGALLSQTEAHFRQEGCACAILTTDTAPEFYQLHGYAHQRGVCAKNGDAVFVKALT